MHMPLSNDFDPLPELGRPGRAAAVSSCCLHAKRRLGPGIHGAPIARPRFSGVSCQDIEYVEDNQARERGAQKPREKTY